MSQSYTISAVSDHTRDYGEGAKAKRVYYVKLEGAEPKEGVRAFELHKMASSKPPEKGHRLDVKLFQEGEHGGKEFVKIIQDYKGDQAGGGNASGGGRDDATGRSIERQVAAYAASYMACAASASDSAGMPNPVKMVANFEEFFDVVHAKITGQPQTQLPTSNGGEIPADTDGLEPAAAGKSDDDIPF